MSDYLVQSANLDPNGRDRVLLRSRHEVGHAASRFRWAACRLLNDLESSDFPELRTDPLQAIDQGDPSDIVLQALQCDPHFPIPRQFLGTGRSWERSWCNW